MSMGNDGAAPWDRQTGGHSTTQVSDGIYKCTECGKWATDERKLEQTRCNEDDDRRKGRGDGE